MRQNHNEMRGSRLLAQAMRWDLTFEPGLEQEFRDEYARKSVRPFRFALAILVSLILFFNLWDIPGYTSDNQWLKVFAIQIPILALTYAITYLKAYVRLAQWIHLGVAWFFAIDNVRLYMQMASPEYEWFATASFMWMTAAVYTLGRLRLPFALLAGGGILALFYALVLKLHPMSKDQLSGALLMPCSLNIVLAVGTYINESYVRREFLLHRLLDAEKQKTEDVLGRVLPVPIAARLKEDPGTIADEHQEATVLFADLVDFTPFASAAEPEEVVSFLNDVFSKFDALVERHALEKIKTVGDAYMVAAGLPDAREDHGSAMVELAIEMLEVVSNLHYSTGKPVHLRIGIHTGPLVAGVIGRRKLLYDLWGDTVNTASRMESHGIPGQIQVTESVVEALRDRYVFEERGLIEVKGKGMMPTYLLVGRRDVVSGSTR